MQAQRKLRCKAGKRTRCDHRACYGVRLSCRPAFPEPRTRTFKPPRSLQGLVFNSHFIVWREFDTNFIDLFVRTGTRGVPEETNRWMNRARNVKCRGRGLARTDRPPRQRWPSDTGVPRQRPAGIQPGSLHARSKRLIRLVTAAREPVHSSRSGEAWGFAAGQSKLAFQQLYLWVSYVPSTERPFPQTSLFWGVKLYNSMWAITGHSQRSTTWDHRPFRLSY